jgi:hypothetical protein
MKQGYLKPVVVMHISSFFTLPHGPDNDLFLVGVDMAEMIFDYL